MCCVCTRQQFSASLDYFVTSSPPYLHQFSTISGGNCISSVMLLGVGQICLVQNVVIGTVSKGKDWLGWWHLRLSWLDGLWNPLRLSLRNPFVWVIHSGLSLRSGLNGCLLTVPTAMVQRKCVSICLVS